MNINNEKISLYTKNNISFIKFKILEQFDNIEHAFYIGKDLIFN